MSRTFPGQIVPNPAPYSVRVGSRYRYTKQFIKREPVNVPVPTAMIRFTVPNETLHTPQLSAGMVMRGQSSRSVATISYLEDTDAGRLMALYNVSAPFLKAELLSDDDGTLFATTDAKPVVARYFEIPEGNLAGVEAPAPETTMFWGLWKAIDFPESDDDKEVTLANEVPGRWDILAHTYYRDVTLWWVIPYVNNIVDATSWPQGTRLRVPSPTLVQQMILQQSE